MNNFWLKLKRPIMVLAPMADVTDAAFRRVIAKYGKPDVMWTEFVSADGLCHSVGRARLLQDLAYTEAERPIVAQLFTAHPEKMREAAKLILDLGFDGLDINMGCPDRSVEKQGAGAALMKNPKLAREIIRAAKEGVQNKIPVSVKTRLGYNKDELDPPTGGWLRELLAEEPAVITIHARTRKEMSKVPARWERVKRAVEIRNEQESETLIFGNGDARDLVHARELAAQSGADGVMLGRAIFGNPWLFCDDQIPVPDLPERLKVLVEHTKLFEELLGDVKSFALMKKHYKSYLAGFPNTHELKNQLMEAADATEVEQIITHFLNHGPK